MKVKSSLYVQSLVLSCMLFSTLNAQLNWRDRHMEPLTLLVDAAHHEGLTVAVGGRSSYGYIYTTTDVTSRVWTEYDYYSPAAFNIIPQGVVRFNDKWVLVDFGGGFSVTTDFVNWTRGFLGTFDISGVREWNGSLYVTGRNGIVKSSDASTWNFTTITTEFTEFTDIAYGAGVYVAVGRAQGKGVMFRSTDAVTWSQVYQVSDDIQMLYSIDFANGKFVATGNGGIVMNSNDGIAWTFPAQTGVSGTMMYVRHVHDHWILSGTNLSFSSQDGTTFVKDNIAVPSARFGTTYRPLEVGDLSVIVGQSGMVFTMGEPLEPPQFLRLPEPIPATAGSLLNFQVSATGFPSDIVFEWTVGGEVVDRATTGSGDTRSSSLINYVVPASNTTLSVVATSSGGSTSSGPIQITVAPPSPWDDWQRHETSVELNFSTHKAYGNGVFLYSWNRTPNATEGSGVYRSTDGINWSSIELTPTQFVSSLAFINNRFVAGTYTGFVLHSEDGLNWSDPIPAITGGALGTLTVNALRLFNGLYMAYNSNSIRYSPDLVNWQAVDSIHLGVTSGLFEYDGRLYNIRNQGVMMWMTSDGINWVQSDIINPFQTVTYSIVYGNGRLVASGISGAQQLTAWSLDGVNWNYRDITNSSAINGPIVFVNGTFFLGAGASSDDGENWIRHNLPNGQLLFGEDKWMVTFGKNVYIGSLDQSYLLEGSVSLGGGWYENDWLGLFHMVNSEYCFHPEYGWLFTGHSGSGSSGAWIHLARDNRWQWFTAATGFGFSHVPGAGWVWWNALTQLWQGF